MKVIDGNLVARKVKQEIANEVQSIEHTHLRVPHLVAVLVGNNKASLTYVDSKIKACKFVGFKSTLLRLPSNVSKEDLLSEIKQLNNNDNVDGFIIQLPLPTHIDEQDVILSISPQKDVDGFHPINVGRMTLGLDTLIPATPSGILELIKAYNIETKGKNVVVIGRSNIVGRPLSILLSQKNYPGDATVTLVNSHTKKVSRITSEADIVITALGKPRYLTSDMVKKGCTVIDVGITRVEDSTRTKGYRIEGDVDFQSVSQKADYITPVPGGVGPMTIAMLLKNTLKAYHRRCRG